MRLLALVALAIAALPAARAQPYPNRPVTLVAPAWSGTPTDTLARAIAGGLSAKEQLGQAVAVETRPGGRAFVGYAHVARAPADGYTLLVVTNQIALPKAIAPDRDFDRKAFEPLGRIAGAPYIVAVPAAVPAKTLDELQRHIATEGERFHVGALANTQAQLDLRRFAAILGVRPTEIPFKTSSPLFLALLGNHIHLSFVPMIAWSGVESGHLRALGVTWKTPFARLPQVPTMADARVDFEAGYWYGLVVRAGTPAPIRERLTKALASALKHPDVDARIAKLGLQTLAPSPEEMAQRIEREHAIAEATLKAPR